MKFLKMKIARVQNSIPEKLREKLSEKRSVFFLFILVMFFFFMNILPGRLFNKPLSVVIEDRNGYLLGAAIAKDGQWRFPQGDSVPYKFGKCIVEFEDSRFYYHPGVDPSAMLRALYINASGGKIISGGSTLTMQVVRLSRDNPPRTVMEKLFEIILALRMEAGYTKESILKMYSSNAPFGGNVVGLEAASWRYFGRSPAKLSWAESAVLAVLPNNPSLIHPGRNRNLLLKKRNRLLKKLYYAGIINELTYRLSLDEKLPGKPKALPTLAPHLLAKTLNEFPESGIARAETTIDINLQRKAAEVVALHYKNLKQNGVNNAAAIIADIETGSILAYIGNTTDPMNQNDNYVDIIQSPRSTGSLLKPFLYAAMLSSGEIMPNSLVADIPVQIGGFAPQNFNQKFDGAVPAARALARSINIPAVKMLQKFKVEKFHSFLRRIGMTKLKDDPGYYGLALILGGAEGTLLDMAGMYAGMARTVKHYNDYERQYDPAEFRPLNFLRERNFNTSYKERKPYLSESGILSASAAWITLEALLRVERPEEDMSWENYSSSRKVAWKTGTSFGFRDGWAIGVDAKYVVGVWIGNADGEGRPGITGIGSAAPVMFDLFNLLPYSSEWFLQPYEEMTEADICRESGYRKTDLCNASYKQWIPLACLKFPACPYHKLVHLDKSENFRVTADCEPPENIIHKSWFVLPPSMEYYYRFKSSEYRTLPPFRDDCSGNENRNEMEMIYPKTGTKIYLPKNLEGQRSSIICQAAHHRSKSEINWHLDESYIGTTTGEHKIALKAKKGKHKLTLVDDKGNIMVVGFEILN